MKRKKENLGYDQVITSEVEYFFTQLSKDVSTIMGMPIDLLNEAKKHRTELKLEKDLLERTAELKMGIDGFGYGENEEEALKNFIKNSGLTKKQKKTIIVDLTKKYVGNPLYPSSLNNNRWYFKTNFMED